MSSSSPNPAEQDPKTVALNGYRKRLLEHRELDAKLKESKELSVTFMEKENGRLIRLL
jgi:26S proteasome regulatory subunit T4